MQEYTFITFSVYKILTDEAIKNYYGSTLK
jgi:hypothetical protein